MMMRITTLELLLVFPKAIGDLMRQETGFFAKVFVLNVSSILFTLVAIGHLFLELVFISHRVDIDFITIIDSLQEKLRA